MKIIKKIGFTVLIFITVISSIPIYSNALGTVIDSGNDFLNQGSSGGSAAAVTPSEENIKKISNTVSNVLLAIAVAVTLISAVVMGINFVVQSVEEKAKIKESMVPWIIGIFISFGAFGIWKMTMSIFYKL